MMTNLKLRAKDQNGVVVYGDCNQDLKFYNDNFIEVITVFETDGTLTPNKENLDVEKD